jgi:hypothetical protein
MSTLFSFLKKAQYFFCSKVRYEKLQNFTVLVYKKYIFVATVVFLPGFQKGRDIKAS